MLRAIAPINFYSSNESSNEVRYENTWYLKNRTRYLERTPSTRFFFNSSPFSISIKKNDFFCVSNPIRQK